MEDKIKTPYYCVMLKFNTGPGRGRVGYHSVWLHKDAAEDHAKLRGGLGGTISYYVEERYPDRVGHNWNHQRCVGFEDSVGLMIVETRTLIEIEYLRENGYFRSTPEKFYAKL
jgi:hypothetical protein